MTTSNVQEELTKKRAALERARQQFQSALIEYQKSGGRYIDRAPEVPSSLLTACRVVSNRYELLNYLPKGGVVAEVGTDQGAFAARIMDTCAPSSLHLFELDLARLKPENVSEAVNEGRCHLVAGDSATNLQRYPHDYFDWIYIDGDHSYEGVKRDTEAAAPRVKPGGYLVFNDYNVWSVTSMRRCGVARAVNEFAARDGWAFVFLALQASMYLDVALQRPF